MYHNVHFVRLLELSDPEISDYQENDHQPSAGGTKAHGNYIATGLGRLDSCAFRMDTRRRVQHGIQTDDACTGLYDTTVYGAQRCCG